MPPKARPITTRDRELISQAVAYLRLARNALTEAKARKASAYAQRALKSAQGAERHAKRVARD